MADKYAQKSAPLPPAERAVNILQCRMSWTDAQACVADLEQTTGVPSTDRVTAIAILAGHMSHRRAVACINDLALYGLAPRGD